MKMKNWKQLVACLAVELLLVQSVLATDRLVPSQYASIHAAYTAAAANDVIVVSDGEYTENSGSGYLLLGTAGKHITIRGASGVSSNVVIKNTSSTSVTILHTQGNLTMEDVIVDGTGLTSINFGAIHSNPATSGVNLTLTRVRTQNLGANTPPIHTVTGTLGTVTLTGCTFVGTEYGARLSAPATTYIIDSTILTGNAGLVLPTAIPPLVIRNGSSITSNTTHGVNLNSNVSSASITDSTVTGGTSSGGDAVRIDTGDTVTTLTISNSTLVCRGASGTCAALEIAGTFGKLSIINGSVLDGGTSGTGLLGYDGTNYGTGTWLYARDSTFTASTLSGLYLERNFVGLDIERCTISSGNSSSTAAKLGIDPIDTNANNPAPMGWLRFYNNTVTKSGTTGHCVLFGNGCGWGTVVGNTFTGGNWCLVIKGSRLHFENNKVYATGTFPAAGLMSSEHCTFIGNTVISTAGNAFVLVNDGRTTSPPKAQWNTITHNIFKSTGGAAFSSDSGEEDNNWVDYNVLYRTDGTPLTSLQGVGCNSLAATRTRWAVLYNGEAFSQNDQNSVSADPKVFDPLVGNWSLSADSSAFGAGTPTHRMIGAWIPNPRQRYGMTGPTGTFGPE